MKSTHANNVSRLISDDSGRVDLLDVDDGVVVLFLSKLDRISLVGVSFGWDFGGVLASVCSSFGSLI